MQALELECEQLRQAASGSAAELAEERRRGSSKERKLMDRTHEAAKLREQLQDAESKHQVQHLKQCAPSCIKCVHASQERVIPAVGFTSWLPTTCANESILTAATATFKICVSMCCGTLQCFKTGAMVPSGWLLQIS